MAAKFIENEYRVSKKSIPNELLDITASISNHLSAIGDKLEGTTFLFLYQLSFYRYVSPFGQWKALS